MLIGLDTLVDILDSIASEHGGRPQLRFERGDPRIDWQELETGTPVIASPWSYLPPEWRPRFVGELDVRRWPLPRGRALLAWFTDTDVRVFLERHDPGVDPWAHLVEDTWIPAGAGVGALAGLLVSHHPISAVVGACVGAGATAAMPPFSTSVWDISTWAERV